VQAPRRRLDRERPTDAAILQAALELFMTKGYRGVSIDAVAEAAGVTKPTVYYHYDDKGTLLVAVARFMFSRAREATAALLARPDPFRKRLQAVAEIVLALPYPFTIFDGVMREVGDELSADQVAAIRAAERDVEAVLEQAFQEAAATGAIQSEDPVFAAHGIVALLRVGQVQDEAGRRRFPDPRDTARRLLDLLWEGIGAPGPDPG
jgi:AcrR family transcriptional regulator